MSQRRSAGHGDGETSGETLATVMGEGEALATVMGMENGDGGRKGGFFLVCLMVW